MITPKNKEFYNLISKPLSDSPVSIALSCHLQSNALSSANLIVWSMINVFFIPFTGFIKWQISQLANIWTGKCLDNQIIFENLTVLSSLSLINLTASFRTFCHLLNHLLSIYLSFIESPLVIHQFNSQRLIKSKDFWLMLHVKELLKDWSKWRKHVATLISKSTWLHVISKTCIKVFIFACETVRI